MANILIPSGLFQYYAVCKDDSLPKFTPDAWILQNRWYKVKYFVEQALNTDDAALTITDKNNNEIHPSSSMSAFKASRFKIEMVCLN